MQQARARILLAVLPFCQQFSSKDDPNSSGVAFTRLPYPTLRFLAHVLRIWHLSIPRIFAIPRAVIFLLITFSSSGALAITCAELDGSYVYAGDGTYLGFFGNNYASDSINNTYGNYGSAYASSSVRNSYGNYGSQYASLSATNPYSSNPPTIYKFGSAIARLTANQFVSGAVSIALIDSSCSFISSSAQTTAPTISAPSTLTGLIASDGLYTDGVFLSWNPSQRATSYTVYFSTTATGSRSYISETANTSLLVTGGTPGVTYYYFVFPKNSAGVADGLYDAGYVALPVNVAPTTSIAGGNRTITDSNNVAGETVALSATSADSDGSIASTQWLVDGQVVATGNSANIALPDGATTVTFRATDDDGATSSTTATITVTAPRSVNVAPTASIIQTSLSPMFSDYYAKRIILQGVAEDIDGSISKVEWHLDGQPVGDGSSITVNVATEPVRVTFTATDDQGAKHYDEKILIDSRNVVLLVPSESSSMTSSSVRITNENLLFSDTDNRNGEWISLTALESMETGRKAVSIEWYDQSGTAFLGQGRTLTLLAPDGISEYSVKVVDDAGKSVEAYVLVTVAPKSLLSGFTLPNEVSSAIRNVGSYNPASNEIHSCVVLRTRKGIFAGLFNVGSKLEVSSEGMFINVVRAPSPAPGETSLEDLAKDCSGNYQLNPDTGLSEYSDLYFIDEKLYRVTGREVSVTPNIKVQISLTLVEGNSL